MRTNPRPQEMYRHFKGNIYQIRCLAKHSETGDPMVVYQAMYGDFQIYVRPLLMFMEEVDHTKYPEAKQQYRFELLKDLSGSAMMQPGRAGQEEAPSEASFAQAKRKEETDPVTEDKQAGYGNMQVSPKEYGRMAEPDEQVQIDPLVMEFLDADTYEQRLNILAALRHRITDDMINTMAVAVDLEIKDGDVQERYEELKGCLLTFEKYECNRLR